MAAGADSPPRLGPYELLCHLASGGMAEIHLGRSRGVEGIEKLVVVKRIHPRLAGNAEAVRMFLREMRVATTLSHPNIVQVHDVGNDGGEYWFAMELVHGEDLRTLARRARETGRAFTLDEALAIVTQVAAGLHHAHEKLGPDGKPLDLIHRDVSPSNVLIGYDGQVKLLDFGIAKARTQSVDTRTGELRGKIGYLSPEQCLSQALDRRSDVFALGIVLWELTTGRRLFDADSEFAAMKKVVEGPAPSPKTVVPEYPAELLRIVMKALARDRDERYATALEVQLELEAFAREARLALSPVTVGRMMEALCGAEIEAWRRAERESVPLAEHLARTRARPVEEVAATGTARPATAQVSRPPARAGRRVALLATGGAVLVAAAVALVLWLRSARTEAPAAGTAPSATVAPAAGTAPSATEAPSATVAPVMERAPGAVNPAAPPVAPAAATTPAAPASTPVVKRPAAPSRKAGRKTGGRDWDIESALPP